MCWFCDKADWTVVGQLQGGTGWEEERRESIAAAAAAENSISEEIEVILIF